MASMDKLRIYLYFLKSCSNLVVVTFASGRGSSYRWWDFYRNFQWFY